MNDTELNGPLNAYAPDTVSTVALLTGIAASICMAFCCLCAMCARLIFPCLKRHGATCCVGLFKNHIVEKKEGKFELIIEPAEHPEVVKRVADHFYCFFAWKTTKFVSMILLTVTVEALLAYASEATLMGETAAEFQRRKAISTYVTLFVGVYGLLRVPRHCIAPWFAEVLDDFLSLALLGAVIGVAPVIMPGNLIVLLVVPVAGVLLLISLCETIYRAIYRLADVEMRPTRMVELAFAYSSAAETVFALGLLFLTICDNDACDLTSYVATALVLLHSAICEFTWLVVGEFCFLRFVIPMRKKNFLRASKDELIDNDENALALRPCCCGCLGDLLVVLIFATLLVLLIFAFASAVAGTFGLFLLTPTGCFMGAVLHSFWYIWRHKQDLVVGNTKKLYGEAGAKAKDMSNKAKNVGDKIGNQANKLNKLGDKARQLTGSGRKEDRKEDSDTIDALGIEGGEEEKGSELHAIEGEREKVEERVEVEANSEEKEQPV